MSNSVGRQVRYSIFGESHGEALGMVVDNLPPGFELNFKDLQLQLNRRKPGQNPWSTPRQESDDFEILSGVYEGKTTGAPLCAIIRNSDSRSKDYEKMKSAFRPSHSDYAAFVKYKGHNDVRGGGSFSGRITAALVLAGGIARQMLALKGIQVVGHVLKSGDIVDESFEAYATRTGDAGLEALSLSSQEEPVVAPMIETDKIELLLKRIESAKQNRDAVGGTLEVALTGIPAGYGNPYFESFESELAKVLFSVPGIKGVSFGAGFEFANQHASEANDAFDVVNGKIVTTTNRSGGLNGGISNGMPIVFQTVFRPTPTVSKVQSSVTKKGERTSICVEGRHDPCIFLRGLPVVEAVAAMVALDILRHDL